MIFRSTSFAIAQTKKKKGGGGGAGPWESYQIRVVNGRYVKNVMAILLVRGYINTIGVYTFVF